MLRTIFILSISLAFLISCSTNSVKVKEPVKKVTLKLEPGPGNPRNSEGDFIKLKDGRILFVYTHFTGGTGDAASAFLAGRYSSDKGMTWTKQDTVILPNEGKQNTMSVSLLRLTSGDIAMLYLRKDSDDICMPYLRKSNDEAHSWGSPVKCVDENGYYVVNNDRLVQLNNGRLIFPSSQHFMSSASHGVISAHFSDDNGKTWKRSEAVPNPEKIILQEPGLIELKDSRLLLFCRTPEGHQYFSFSGDNGKTWSAVAPGNIKSPLSPASIKRIPKTGDLLLVWNNNFAKGRDGGRRTPFNMAISKDEAKTWEKVKTIESDPMGWYCYTAIELVDDNVLLGHCAGDTRTNNGLSTTNITVVNLDWVYADATPAPYIASDDNGLITLGCKDRNAQIFYTLDSNLPGYKKGELYEKPFKITHLTPLTMQAFSPGKTESRIVSITAGTGIIMPAVTSISNPHKGFKYRYFEGKAHNTSQIKDLTLIAKGNVQNISLEKARREKDFAFIFDGFINAPENEIYTFYLTSNDGSALYIDNIKIIDNDGAHGKLEKSAKVTLQKGLHKVTLYYFQNGGGSAIKAEWAGKGMERQLLKTAVQIE